MSRSVRARALEAVSALVGLVVLVGLGGPLVGPARAAAGPGRADDAVVPSSRLVTPRDPRLTETSGMVDRGATVVLTDDSGSCACLYVVSTRTGRTVGVTRWRARTRDVEALAPAGPRAVWVGDVGDNAASRRRITVYRVPVGPGSRTVRAAAYDLAYPGRAHDAESLLVDPQGRFLVVTKSFAGGTVFRTAGRLRAGRVNRLQPVARVAELATDAAFTRDGRVVLVRGPAAASAYAYPSWQRLTSFRLPAQRQGEALSVGPDGRVLLAGEGVRTPVLRIALPAAATASPSPSATASPTPSPTTTPSPTASPTPSSSPSTGPSAAGPDGDSDDASAGERPDGWLLWSVPAVIVVGALGIGLGLRRRQP